MENYTVRAESAIKEINICIENYNKGDFATKKPSDFLMAGIIFALRGILCMQIENNSLKRVQNIWLKENASEIKSLKNMLKNKLKEKENEK